MESSHNLDGSNSVAPRNLKKWLPWLTKGTLAIADQGIFAVSNFVVNVLLARWLSAEDYGAFALAYSIFLSLLLMHSALMTTPMLVFTQAKHQHRFRSYLGVLLRAHVLLTLAGSLLLGIVALAAGQLRSHTVEMALFALAAGSPFILLLWLLRRAFYACLQPAWAAASGLVYFCGFVSGIWGLHVAGHLNPLNSFACMAAASLLTSIVLLIKLQPSFKREGLSLQDVLHDHWNYGKWVAAGAGPNWITDNIYFIVLPASFGLAQAGALKALLNLAQPASQSVSALGVLLMPVLVRRLKAGGLPAMAKSMQMATALLIAGTAAYAITLWLLRGVIVNSLYGGRFNGYGASPLIAAALIPIAQCLPNVAGAALGAIERPRMGFWADTWSAGFALIAGVPLAYFMGLTGALLGITLSYIVMGFLTLHFYRRAVRMEGSTPETLAHAVAMPGAPAWEDQP